MWALLSRLSTIPIAPPASISSDGSMKSAAVLCWRKPLLSRCANHSRYITPPKATTTSVVCSRSIRCCRRSTLVQQRGTSLSAFSPKKKAASASASGSELLPLGLPRIAVAPLRVSFFAPRARKEEMLQVRNWTKNNHVWTHRNKRKAAISWHGIT
ncbi:hypothetical protein HN873_042610 [Arachis hypogaea]|uniref:Uncharacterized protein n=1 Tax=Arachis hypogaea TaxID=3818 RepID=A0A445A751_ARAHY|nr:hypothetical protein Ahy_B03g067451 [Arachis hypogaea]